MPRKKQLSFEDGIKQLENIVESLESDEVNLEESLNLYKSGIELLYQCSEILDRAEQQIVILQKDLDGKFVQKPFLNEM